MYRCKLAIDFDSCAKFGIQKLLEQCHVMTFSNYRYSLILNICISAYQYNVRSYTFSDKLASYIVMEFLRESFHEFDEI